MFGYALVDVCSTCWPCCHLSRSPLIETWLPCSTCPPVSTYAANRCSISDSASLSVPTHLGGQAPRRLMIDHISCPPPSAARTQPQAPPLEVPLGRRSSRQGPVGARRGPEPGHGRRWAATPRCRGPLRPSRHQDPHADPRAIGGPAALKSPMVARSSGAPRRAVQCRRALTVPRPRLGSVRE